MTDNFVAINARVKTWLQCAVAEGWLEKVTADMWLNVQKEASNDLFATDSPRPLMVAFMGGTGVGKSSLLNKLANQSIAQAGIERPTSREVTLYHHQSVSLQLLQKTLPVQQIKISPHSEVANQHIVWLDMPDFDSTEQHNKSIVLQCLPFIDVLIYVVSPERYKDDKAWQLLLTQGTTHAWVFAFNQWDRGEIGQYKDFQQQLAKAGFQHPLIYKTVCMQQAEDEFTQLRHTIQSIATEKTIKQLESRASQQRRHNTQTQLQNCVQTLGEPQAFLLLTEYQNSSWIQTQKILEQGFEWRIQQAAKYYIQAETGFKQSDIKIWDDWAQSRLNDHLDKLIVMTNQHGLPATPIRKSLLDCRNKATKIVHTQMELTCRQALINPGNVLHRALLKTTHVAEIILPLLAMGAVGFKVFQGYYDSSLSHTEFLGINFAVHSILLILISWAMPYFISKKMQPSLEKTALKGLHNGLNMAMAMLNIEILQAIKNYQQQHSAKLEALHQIIATCDSHSDKIKTHKENSLLAKMLLD